MIKKNVKTYGHFMRCSDVSIITVLDSLKYNLDQFFNTNYDVQNLFIS